MRYFIYVIIFLVVASCSNTSIYNRTVTQGSVFKQEDIDKLIQIQNLSQRGINLDGIKIIYEMRDRISDLQIEIESLKKEIKLEKNQRSRSEKEIHKSYKNEIVKKSNKDLRRN